MSSIEKAMDKLAGRSSAAETPAPPDPTAEQPPQESPAATDEDAVSEPDVAIPAALVGEATDVADAVGTSQPPLAETRVPDDPPGNASAKETWLDFDRLEAEGFLTPQVGHTREAEEYQHIKRRLLGNIVLKAGAEGRPANLVMITSSVPSEGKTFTSVNLAMSISLERDFTVLVVDTDLMRRDLSRQFNLVDSVGLFDYLVGDVDDIGEVIYRTNRSNLAVIPAGTYMTSSTELMASTRMKDAVNEFSTRYSDRIVLFDTPPLLATTTAVALAPQVGQLILVVEAGETRSTTLQEALRVLDRTPITGLILNKAKTSPVTSYDYYGSYYRFQDEG